MFTFLSPLYLIGMLAAAIPLIVHLSRSRRQRKLRFSTTRFFTDQFLRSYRMSKLKEIGLLLARMALFALLALALAQPLAMPRGRSYLAGRRNVVLVLDNSASMACFDDGMRLFDRARVAARRLLDELRPGDTAALVLAGRRADGPEAVFPEPTTAIDDVRRALDALPVAPLGTDLSRAVGRAEMIARSGSASSREVYVLSDLQDSGWEVGGLPARSGDSDVLFFFVQVRPRRPANLALTALQFAAARPMAGLPFAIRPQVLNQGSASRAAEVSLYVDGAKVGQQGLAQLQPGRWSSPLFHHTFTRGGWHSGYIEVEDDGLTTDNRRWFAFEVMDAIRVLAVNGAPSTVASQDELFFLQTALTAGQDGPRAIQVETVSPNDCERALAAAAAGPAPPVARASAPIGYSLVVLANVASLPPGAVDQLERYVDEGGALFVFLGDQVQPRFYNDTLAAESRLQGGLLPARLDGILGDPAGREDTGAEKLVGEVDPEHPALTAFSDPQFAPLTGVRFRAFWQLVPPAPSGTRPGEPTTVLMRTNTGEPLLCEKRFGQGRVLLFASTADRDWNSFPVTPVYLPWIHRLTGYLAQQPLGRDNFFLTGDRVPVPVSATRGIEPLLVRQPDGTIRQTVANGNPPRLEFSQTDQIGVYSLLRPGAGDAPEQLFVANLEGYESDLTYLDDVLVARGGGLLTARGARVEAGFKDLLPGRALVTFVAEPDQIIDASLRARRGIKLWDIFLVVVLLIALFEPWLANRISLRHYTAPGTKPPRSNTPSSRAEPRSETPERPTRMEPVQV
ncbi:BatA domain-containing protein [bacterium]|nr:BatA domain-containing protein [bacterium]